MVEDNELNQEVASELLQQANLVVELAENGKIALEKVHESDYDAVLMDMQMPVMDGITATREILKLPKCKDLPIIAMTANVLQSDRDKCLAAGMVDHVGKPIEPDELWQALLKWIKPRTNVPSTTVPRSTEKPQTYIPTPSPGSIEGLDVALGLKRVLGKHSLYISMLRMFSQGQAAAVENIRTSLQTDDRAKAERLAHTLKSTAGNIGASAIQSLASRVEEALAAGEPPAKIRIILEELAPSLAALIAALRTALPPEQKAVSNAPVDEQKLTALVGDLCAMLSNDDARAIDVLNENTELFRAAFADKLRQIEKSIRNFDYEEALAVLKIVQAQRT